MYTVLELRLKARAAGISHFGKLSKKELCTRLGLLDTDGNRVNGTGVTVGYQDGSTETFPSISAAARALGKNTGSISYFLSKGTKMQTEPQASDSEAEPQYVTIQRS